MDYRELIGGTRLVQLGNPWGDRSRVTWKGKWGNDSPEYKTAVAAKLLPSSIHEIPSKGQFWISWQDVLKFFASMEICRTDPVGLDRQVRVQGWLPAATGLGDVIVISTNCEGEKIRADISLYQESNAVRESAHGGSITSVDLGMVLVDSNGGPAYVVERTFASEISCEVFLDPGKEYLVVPISLANSFKNEHRKFVACIRYSSQCGGDLMIRKLPQTITSLRDAIMMYFPEIGAESIPKQLFPGLYYKFIQDSAGAIVLGENRTTCVFASVMLDGEDSTNIASSRAGSGGLIVHDTLPPASEQIMMIMTPNPGAKKYGMSLAARVSWDPHNTSATHVPPIAGEDVPPILGIHVPYRLRSSEHLMSIRDLFASNPNDPYVLSTLMLINAKQKAEVQRLVNELVEAGIDREEAQTIAIEQIDNMYL
jgi:hypothetical protein